MRILFLTPQLPYPPHKGTTLRTFGLVRGLASNHDVAVLSLGDRGDTGNIEALGAHCRVVGVVAARSRPMPRRLLDLTTRGLPDLALRLDSGELRATLDRLLREEPYEIVQIEGLEMVRVWLETARRGAGWRRQPIAVLDEHNAEYRLQETAAAIDRRDRRLVGGAYSWLQARRLRHFERLACEQVDGVLAVSPEDQEALRELGVRAPIQVIPNCLDVGRLPFLPFPDQREPAEIVFTGTMDYRPNVDAVRWFCADVWPRVLARRPEARFTIVGRDPSAAVLELAQQHGVTVTGAVPSVGPYLRRATVYAVPMRMGGGVRFKVLEALAAGLPVVSTTMGATGVDLTPGRDALLADDAGDMATTIVRLFDRPEERLAMATAGRELVERRFDWAVAMPALEAFYAHLARRPLLGSPIDGARERRGAG